MFRPTELLCFSLWQSLVADTNYKSRTYLQARIQILKNCLSCTSLHFIYQMNELIKNALDLSQLCM